MEGRGLQLHASEGAMLAMEDQRVRRDGPHQQRLQNDEMLGD